MFQILVVEDDRELNLTVCAFLNSSGYEATGWPGAPMKRMMHSMTACTT